MRFLEHVQVKDREKENIFIVQVIVFFVYDFFSFLPSSQLLSSIPSGEPWRSLWCPQQVKKKTNTCQSGKMFLWLLFLLLLIAVLMFFVLYR